MHVYACAHAQNEWRLRQAEQALKASSLELRTLDRAIRAQEAALASARRRLAAISDA